MIGKQTIKDLELQLERNLAQELKDQGHYLTGALERSIQSVISETNNGQVLETTAAEYIEDVNQFTPPGEINIDNQEFESLKRWVKLRGMATNQLEATQIAAAIVAKWKKEGRPTHESKAFSKTGERTHAIETSYNDHEQQYDQLIENGLSEEIDEFIDITFDQTIF